MSLMQGNLLRSMGLAMGDEMSVVMKSYQRTIFFQNRMTDETSDLVPEGIFLAFDRGSITHIQPFPALFLKASYRKGGQKEV
jgi:hypothetical protein